MLSEKNALTENAEEQIAELVKSKFVKVKLANPRSYSIIVRAGHKYLSTWL